MPPRNLSCPFCGCEHFDLVLGIVTLTLVCTVCLWEGYVSLGRSRVDKIGAIFEPGGG